jgi:hypothetical protein
MCRLYELAMMHQTELLAAQKATSGLSQ